MSWKWKEPTEKQLLLIDDMRKEIGCEFTGKTRGDAHKFISEHISEYYRSRRDYWAIINGYD